MHLLLRNLRPYIARTYHRKSAAVLAAEINRDNISSKYSEALEKFKERILFNSLLEVQKLRIRNFDEIASKEIRWKIKQEDAAVPIPLVLSQLCDDQPKKEMSENDEKTEVQKDFSLSALPFSRFLKVQKSSDDETDDIEEVQKKTPPKNWLKDYELYDEAEEELDSEYGTPDPLFPVTEVPCGGCGALLHCKE